MSGLIYLLALGFIIGLSGAMMPGPLLVYTLSESMKKGVKTGPLVILGHALVELALIVLIALGLSGLMTSRLFMNVVGWAGGLALIAMAASLLKSRWNLDEMKVERGGSIVLGGMFFSAFNPGFPVWWATAGAAMLLKGFDAAGYWGVAAIVVGHWIADVGYYTLISGLVHYGRKSVLTSTWVNYFKNMLAVFLGLIGVYFIYWVSGL
jgi:threonine/homoserine/homoserine lactone efflux protein